MIDHSRYEGHTPALWTLCGPSRERTTTGRLHDEGGDYAIMAGSEIIAEAYRRVSANRVEPVLANAYLMVDAPALAAENVKLREALETVCGIAAECAQHCPNDLENAAFDGIVAAREALA